MGDAVDARAALLDWADRVGWPVNEDDQLDDWVSLRAAVGTVELLVDALEHCGYDETDCIDCGGPPHNEWCRFWKLRDVVPLLFPQTQA